MSAVIAVDVIDVLTLLDIFKKRVVPEDVEGVPADLGYFQRRVFQVRLQRADLALDKAEACLLYTSDAADEL